MATTHPHEPVPPTNLPEVVGVNLETVKVCLAYTKARAHVIEMSDR